MPKLIYIGNQLSRHGKNITTIETLGPVLEAYGYEVVYASSVLSKPLRMLHMLWTVLHHARTTDYVLIDTYSTQNFWFAYAVGQLCRLLRIPYIPKLHGGDLEKRLRKSPRCCHQLFDNALVNVAPSGFLMDVFQRNGFGKLLYIPNTVALSNYRYEPRNSVGPRLLFVRSLAQIYNPEMAIEVAAALTANHPETQLCMVGPDKEGLAPQITRLAQQKGVNLKLTGQLTKEEWTRLATGYDIFINTTHIDNTPISLIEAMALGLPVITTNVGGLPYLITDGQTGLLVNDSDVTGMVRAIERLIADPDLVRHIVRNGHEMVQFFDFDAVMGQWVEILK